jgi:hypothetical protein
MILFTAETEINIYIKLIGSKVLVPQGCCVSQLSVSQEVVIQLNTTTDKAHYCHVYVD